MKSLYQRFFNSLPVRFVDTDTALQTLTADELYLVRSTERSALFMAAYIELAVYLLAFLPVYRFPEFFDGHAVALGGPFTHLSQPFPWIRQLWMFGVDLVELYALLILNLAAVHGIAVATGYLQAGRKPVRTDGLIRIALAEKFRGERELGINPFDGLNHWLLYGYLLFNRAKGYVGAVAVRAGLAAVYGSDILDIFLDFSGLPIYVAINVYSTRVILRKARVVIMGQASIEALRRSLPAIALSPAERELVYDTLEFVAVSKGDYHINHYNLAQAVLGRYAIPVEASHPLTGNYLEKLRTSRPPVAELCRVIIVAGFVLDGSITGHECRQLEALRLQGILDASDAELRRFCENFVDGQGLAAIAERFIGTLQAH